MNYPETFELMAELSLALAGFSGVAASLGGRDRDFREIEKMRLIAVLHFSAISLGAALLVMSLMDAGLAPETVYSLALLASAGSLLIVLGYSAPKVFRLAREGESSTSRGFLAVSLAFFGTLVGLYVWAGFYARTSWPLLIGISLQLMYGLWNFARLLLRSR